MRRRFRCQNLDLRPSPPSLPRFHFLEKQDESANRGGQRVRYMMEMVDPRCCR